jgi:hypothetical protein
MDHREIFYRLLARALLDIRIAAHEGRVKSAFRLADLVHNVPYMLLKLDESSADYVLLMRYIDERCEQKDLMSWKTNALRDITENAESSSFIGHDE